MVEEEEATATVCKLRDTHAPSSWDLSSTLLNLPTGYTVHRKRAVVMVVVVAATARKLRDSA